MIFRIAEFRVKPDKIEPCLAAIREFVAAVAEEEGTLAYGSYRKPDGVSFVHTMVFVDEDALQAHRRSPHERAFALAVYPCCAIEPRYTTLEEIAAAR